jgi:hypothetical protein
MNLHHKLLDYILCRIEQFTCSLMSSMSTWTKRFTTHSLESQPNKWYNSLNTLYLSAMSLWRKFMKSKTPSRYVRCCFWNRFQYRWRFLRFDNSFNLPLSGVVLLTTSYKSTAGRDGMNAFWKELFFFGFYRH